ncbi:hypothetical protein ACGFW5_20425 [Streptomyces sp. NPDC048416]|uniref:hypothetical protein n=1 Tax=Streptomyces sp. NPDC048416 TaxID=3365546 RepID=UPI0037144431
MVRPRTASHELGTFVVLGPMDGHTAPENFHATDDGLARHEEPEEPEEPYEEVGSCDGNHERRSIPPRYRVGQRTQAWQSLCRHGEPWSC